MSTNRTRIKRPPKGRRITPEVIAAWQACDYMALHAALGLTPWNSSPLPEEITALGVSQDDAPGYMDKFQREDWRNMQVLQRELLKAAGWPDCREAYKKNLAEALDWRRYCKELVDHPDHGGTGTGCDPASRRQKLEEAKARVAYRRKLLASLDEMATT